MARLAATCHHPALRVACAAPRRWYAANAARERECLDLVRRSDYDYFLMGLLMPESSRAGFYAVRAFNVETGTIVDSTRGNVLPARVRRCAGHTVRT